MEENNNISVVPAQENPIENKPSEEKIIQEVSLEIIKPEQLAPAIKDEKIETNLFEQWRGKKPKPKIPNAPTIDKIVGGIDLTAIEEKKKLRERTGLYAIILTVNTIAVIWLGLYSFSHPLVKKVEVEKVVEKIVEKEKIIKQNEEIYRINDNTTLVIAVDGSKSTLTLKEFRDKMIGLSEEQKKTEMVFLVSVEDKTIHSKLNSVSIAEILSGEIRIKAE